MRELIGPFALFCLASCAAAPVQNSAVADGSTRSPWAARLIDPVSAGTTFESPVVETSLEGHVVHQNFPGDSIFDGGDYQVYALQARFALNDRWAIIATKDGYVDVNPGAGGDEEGLADIAGGFKFIAHEDADSGVIVTPGLIFETTTGDEEVFQGNGDGLLRPFVAVGWDRGKLNLIGTVGYNHPLDDEEESASVDYHLHASYEVAPNVFPLLELNGITYTSDGNALPVDFEGGDLINLGADDVSGNTVVSSAFGVAYRIGEQMQAGLTYEVPLTSREDLLDDRFWFAFLFRF